MAAAADDSTTPPITILLRRNSIVIPPVSATTTTTATSTSSLFSPSSVDFDLISIKPTCYTSLRDILPSSDTIMPSSRHPFAANSGYEILIRNRLVKQAAWAYLQPVSTFPETDGSTTFRRLWTQFSRTLIRLITAAFDFLLRSIKITTTASELYHVKR